MAQAKRKIEWDAGVRPAVTGAEHAMPVPSPARALQQLLAEQNALSVDEARWSRRRAATFIVAASASLWLALLAAAQGVMTSVI